MEKLWQDEKLSLELMYFDEFVATTCCISLDILSVVVNGYGMERTKMRLNGCFTSERYAVQQTRMGIVIKQVATVGLNLAKLGFKRIEAP